MMNWIVRHEDKIKATCIVLAFLGVVAMAISYVEAHPNPNTITHRIERLEATVDSLRLRVRKQPADSGRDMRAERDSIVTAAALKYGVEPRIAVAVARVEVPNTDSMAISHAGAVGLMQVVPRWWEHYRALICEERSLFDRECSAEVGVFILLTLYQMHGDWPSALRAYNTGYDGPSTAGRHYLTLVEARLGEGL